jgi:hypothetical protein
MNEDTELSYDKEWLAEFEKALADQTIPCVEYIPPLEHLIPPSLISQNILTKGGDTYYTLEDDCQFAVADDHPNAESWSNG